MFINPYRFKNSRNSKFNSKNKNMLNIGIIGYGYWGPNIARNIHESKIACLKVICDYKADRLELAKLKYLDQTSYSSDYKSLINDPELDAIAIAVETESHFYIAKEVILAGKHVFIEKPMTPTVKDALELKQLAKENKVTIHVDHIMIFHPAIKKIKKMIIDNELGKAIYFDSSRLNLGKIKNDVSAMWDLAVHDLAVIDFLIGGIKPDTISVMGEKYWSKKESLTFLTLKDKKFIAHLKSSWISPIKERKIIVAGTKKMIVFDDMRSGEKFLIYDKGFDSEEKEYENIEYNDYAVKARDGDVLIPSLPIEDALLNSVEHFVNAAQNNTESISNADQAIRVIEILEAADRQLAN
jgi:predicted dehydrogenase